MSNTIRIKRSLTTSTPTSLANGELAYTANGDVLFIGSNASIVAIGGVRNPGVLTSNQALVTNSSGYINEIRVANAVIGSVYANGSFGTQGQLLTANSSGGLYFSNPLGVGGVASLVAGDGITSNTSGVFVTDGDGLVVNSSGVHVGSGNGIVVNATATSVLANAGIISNSTGVFVNSAYINTISANNSYYLNGISANRYIQNNDSRTLSGNLVIAGYYFNPSSNTVFLGNNTQRWIISGNTGSFSNAITGTSASFSTSVNSALLTVGTNFIANASGVYHTGVVNAASHVVGSSFNANTTGVYHTGVVNAAQFTVGSSFVANDSVLSVSTPFSVNGSTGTAGQILTTNGSTGSPYWDNLGGNYVQSTDSRALSGNLVISGTYFNP